MTDRILHIAFFSGDITRSGGTENVSVMIANTLALLSTPRLYKYRNSKCLVLAVYTTAVQREIVSAVYLLSTTWLYKEK